MKKLMTLLVLLGLTGTVLAKAYFAPKKEMIRNAEAIVVVEITASAKAEKKAGWTYSQKVTATIKRCLKGDIKGTIEICGGEDFICAQNKYEKGKFLLFLRKSGDVWTGANWHLGTRAITGDQVDWFSNETDPHESKPAPLADVLTEIESQVKQDAAAK